MGPGNRSQIITCVHTDNGCTHRGISVRSASISERLAVVGQNGWLDNATTKRLASSHSFLRTVESKLRLYDGKRRHDFPENENQRSVIAHAIGGSDSDSTMEKLKQSREFIHSTYRTIFYES